MYVQQLKKSVDKDASIRLGSWEDMNLDENQCMYAATDAYVSLSI